jgi:hypothetical protein
MQIIVKNLTTLQFDNPYLPRSSCRWHRQRQQRRTIDNVRRAGSASMQENRASVDLNQNHDTGKHANQPACIDGLIPNHDGKLETWFSPFAKLEVTAFLHQAHEAVLNGGTCHPHSPNCFMIFEVTGRKSIRDAAGQRLGLTALTKTSKNDNKTQAGLRVACVVLERCAPLETTAVSRRWKRVEMCAVREWY